MASALRKTERIEMRANTTQRDILNQATDASGLSMSDFILNAALAQASDVLEKQNRVSLNQSEFDCLLGVIEANAAPNKVLLEAAELARASGD